MSDPAPYLVIWEQAHPHDEGVIRGNAAGLRLLRDVIDQALQYPSEVLNKSGYAFPSDGEGYMVVVTRFDDKPMDFFVPPYHFGDAS